MRKAALLQLARWGLFPFIALIMIPRVVIQALGSALVLTAALLRRLEREPMERLTEAHRIAVADMWRPHIERAAQMLPRWRYWTCAQCPEVAARDMQNGRPSNMRVWHARHAPNPLTRLLSSRLVLVRMVDYEEDHRSGMHYFWPTRRALRAIEEFIQEAREEAEQREEVTP